MRIKKIQIVLLTVSLIIMIVIFTMTVWDDLSHKDNETIRHEQEREARRIECMEWIKSME